MIGFVVWDASSASEWLRLNPDVTWNSRELRFSIVYVIRKAAGKHALNTRIGAKIHSLDPIDLNTDASLGNNYLKTVWVPRNWVLNRT